MITKERLKELIEQRGTIYWIKDGASRMEIDLTLAKITEIKDEGCVVWVEHLNNFYCLLPYAELTDNKEEAEWHKEFGCIERTERLELPTWEEAENMDKLTICEFDWYRLLMCPADNIGDNGWIGIDSGGNCEIYHWDNSNKENYLKACRKCKELFLGGKDE